MIRPDTIPYSMLLGNKPPYPITVEPTFVRRNIDLRQVKLPPVCVTKNINRGTVSRQDVFNLIARSPRSIAEISRLFGITSKAASQHVSKLVSAGHVEIAWTEKTKGRTANVYAVTGEQQ